MERLRHTFEIMSHTLTPPPKPVAAGVCLTCSWRHGRGPLSEDPPLSHGRCDLCRGETQVMPLMWAELEPVALAWVALD